MYADMVSAASVWAVAAQRLQQRNEASYRQWGCKLVPVRLGSSNELVLGVDDDFFGEWVATYFCDMLTDALRDIDGVSYSFSFEAGHAPAPVPPVRESKPKAATTALHRPSGVPRRGPNYSFSNFVVCEANRYAFTVVKDVVERPGFYNPLFLYGLSGCGKTHLLRAAEAEAADNGLRVRYAACSELLDEFYKLLQNKGDLNEFRASLRDVDILLIDDVHVLAGKTQLQEEFFKLFNFLYSRGQQIVLTSDKQPCEIHGLEDRLITRFESGMTSEVNMPEVEGRFAILRMMRDEAFVKVRLDDTILQFLAEQISSSVRRLKGAFMRLATVASMRNNTRITVEQAEQLLAAQLGKESSARDIPMDLIQRLVADRFGLTVADIRGNRRPRNIAEPRMVAMYLCRTMTKHSLPEIGVAFNKTHATILNAVNKVPELCAHDDTLRRTVQQLEHQLKRG
ncbi:MAG: chromosomal replication initiator protein DnaA [Lentisphaeria bacterium]|nr:chromosomal replication initiator protein DnaA [Lentisphaeria bacterium]